MGLGATCRFLQWRWIGTEYLLTVRTSRPTTAPLSMSPPVHARFAERRAMRHATAAAVELPLCRASVRAAFEAGQFALSYQPILRTSDLAIVGCEALLRWEHPTRGQQSPAQFVPILERSELAHTVGAWVLEEAATRVQQWRQKWSAPLRLTVNVASLQLLSPEFPALVQGVLDRSGLPATALSLDVPAELFADRARAKHTCVAKLAALGIGIEVDDFNAGPSALANLQAQSVTGFKLDRRFLEGVGAEGSDVRTLAQLAQRLGMRAVAESVQTEYELAVVHAAGITELQGYLFCRALPPPAFENYLRARSSSRVEQRGD